MVACLRYREIGVPDAIPNTGLWVQLALAGVNPAGRVIMTTLLCVAWVTATVVLKIVTVSTLRFRYTGLPNASLSTRRPVSPTDTRQPVLPVPVFFTH